LVPDPRGSGRAASIERAAAGAECLALGPAGALAELAGSWSPARSLLRASAALAVRGEGVLVAEDHLAELLLLEGGALARRIAARRLGPLEGLTPKARERMRETALAYVQNLNSPTAMARALHLHPQTARYRTARLRELLGDQLDDADALFELEIALRHRGAAV